MPLDLKPAAARLSALIAAVPADALDNPTPCSDYTVAALLDHLQGITVAFGGAAEKAGGTAASMGPQGDPANLEADWRESLPRKLTELAEKWDDPEAWSGMTTVGGQEAPAEMIGVVTAGEMSVHGWDLAQGAGLPYEPDPASVAALYDVAAATFAGPDGDARRGGAFGPAVPVAPEAPIFDRVLGLLGRDPHWTR